MIFFIGFLRKDESKEVKESLSRLGLEIIVKNSFLKFFKATTTVRKANSTYNTETPMLCFAINTEKFCDSRAIACVNGQVIE